jgi:hypothetical protein
MYINIGCNTRLMLDKKDVPADSVKPVGYVLVSAPSGDDGYIQRAA